MRLRLAIVVVALASGFGIGATGCGGASQTVGDIIMTVTVPEGAQVQSAQYTIDDKTHVPMQGIVGAPEPEPQFVDLIPHVPVGDQYVATVQAESTDGQMVCSGSAPIEVMNGVTTRVQIALKCGGHVLVAIGVSCLDTPLVDFLVSPIVAPVGTFVVGRADDARPDGGALAYTWSALSGTFSDPGGSRTDFTCTQVGPVKISLTVQDDELCEQSYSSTVTCLAPVDGGADAGLPDAGHTNGDASDALPAHG